MSSYRGDSGPVADWVVSCDLGPRGGIPTGNCALLPDTTIEISAGQIRQVIQYGGI